MEVSGRLYLLGYNPAENFLDVSEFTPAAPWISHSHAKPVIGITPTSPAPGQIPLVMLPIWSHPWAPGWTRFAFFQFGGENFFLKTNIGNPKNTKVKNVNIDHVLDNISTGTVEVVAMSLPDYNNLTNVEPFTMGSGDPYFVTYLSKSGAVTLNRFHGDCLGWSQVASLNAPAAATLVVPIATSGGQRFFLFV